MNMYFISLLTAEEIDHWIEELRKERKRKEMVKRQDHGMSIEDCIKEVCDMDEEIDELEERINEMKDKIDKIKCEQGYVLDHINCLIETKGV